MAWLNEWHCSPSGSAASVRDRSGPSRLGSRTEGPRLAHPLDAVNGLESTALRAGEATGILLRRFKLVKLLLGERFRAAKHEHLAITERVDGRAGEVLRGIFARAAKEYCYWYNGTEKDHKVL